MSDHYNPGANFFVNSKQGPRNLYGKPDYHGGWDFVAPSGSKVVPAAADGVVVYRGYNSSFGNLVVLQHTGASGSTFYTAYAHMANESNMPHLGDVISKGDTLGIVGGTGTAAAGRVHLHFQMFREGTPIAHSDKGGSLGFNYKILDTTGHTVSINPETFDDWPAGGPYGAGYPIKLAGLSVTEFFDWLEPSKIAATFLNTVIPVASAATFARFDPLVLDLNGDGIIETTDKAMGDTYFDFEGAGFSKATGWVGPNEGLVVRDLNGNGRIDNGSELFGDQTILPDATKASNGFKAIAALDSNGDGKVDAADGAWNELKLWIDANSNGIAEEGELLSMDAAGVTSINTQSTSINSVDSAGNTLAQSGSFTRIDGSSGDAASFIFSQDSTDSIATDSITVSAEIAMLPDIAGMGNVYSLHQAMAREARILPTRRASTTTLLMCLATYTKAAQATTRSMARLAPTPIASIEARAKTPLSSVMALE